MHQIRKVIKKAFTPVTLMMIPHSNKPPYNLKIPFICIILLIFFGSKFGIKSEKISIESTQLNKNYFY